MLQEVYERAVADYLEGDETHPSQFNGEPITNFFDLTSWGFVEKLTDGELSQLAVEFVTKDKHLWIGYKLSNSSVMSGVLSVPAALAQLIQGSYRLVTGSGEPVGTLTVQKYNMWGLKPFFSKWGVEKDDYVVVTFDTERKEAVIEAGDEEILARAQEDLPIAAVSADNESI